MALPEWALSLLHPWQFMLISLSFLPATLRAESLSTILFHPSRLRAAWFGRFWAFVAPNVRTHAEPHVVPLLQGRVSAGVVPRHQDSSVQGGDDSDEDRLHHPPVSGTVLEIGPGSGMWVSLFTPRFLNPNASKDTPPITKIYGIEPNVGVHPLLRAQIAAAGLDTPSPANNNSTYEILPVGIESLASSGRVAPQSVDCIVTVLCLCSIPQPRENIAQLYGYLKPGGRWYVYEHVKCFREQGWGMRAYQAFLNLFWPQFIGGCEMCRDTNTYLKEAGPWSNVDVHRMDDELWCYTMPHIIGVLTK
ncbi:S-adenosyl-L-methionine-dependent methyltransferase [Dichotomopilus funicola]|uniref:S-adenosyl-L-methionine-dependent methyltransferase n=1 Tax=Dichotomopilus funicola TaxID=1934379 RepID=A0AAN6UWR1_9PEZI|nr:S-adenosyl-L-methionine-dependent methyltransferase [Dichotomopilus funicola]